MVYWKLAAEVPGLTLADYDAVVREVAQGETATPSLPAAPIYPSPPTYRSPPYTVPSLPRYTPRPSLPRYTPPKSGSTCDWQSGNYYTAQKSPSGNTRLNGMNLGTGSMWNTTIKPNGSMNGWDSKMNPWAYDSRGWPVRC